MSLIGQAMVPVPNPAITTRRKPTKVMSRSPMSRKIDDAKTPAQSKICETSCLLPATKQHKPTAPRGSGQNTLGNDLLGLLNDVARCETVLFVQVRDRPTLHEAIFDSNFCNGD